MRGFASLALALQLAVTPGCGPAAAGDFTSSFYPSTSAAAGLPSWTEHACPAIGDFSATGFVTAVADTSNVCTFSLNYANGSTNASGSNKYKIPAAAFTGFDPRKELIQVRLSDFTDPDVKTGTPWVVVTADVGACYGTTQSSNAYIGWDASNTKFAVENSQANNPTPWKNANDTVDHLIVSMYPHSDGANVAEFAFTSAGGPASGAEIYSASGPQQSEWEVGYDTAGGACMFIGFGQASQPGGTGSMAFKLSTRQIELRE